MLLKSIFVKDSSFAPDGIRISEHGILRDYFTDNSGYPTGFLFDEFSSSIRWVYPLKEIAINCKDLAIYAYTLNDNKDLVVFYNCDSASGSQIDFQSSKGKINYKVIAKNQRVKHSVMSNIYWKK